MRRISLLISFAIGASLLSPAYAQPETSVTASKIGAARKQTAIALRAVATRQEFGYLARLGDFASARKLADNSSVALYTAQDALQKDDLATAEREIKLMGDSYRVTTFWLQLSKRYHELKRPADARRTAFYAVTQVRRDKDHYRWGDVAQWLCEIGEQPAARRLFAVAQKELLDPDPLFGSAQDYVVATAASCGFDDIALKGKAGWASSSLISIYARKNRDDIARRVIERAETEIGATFQKTLKEAKPEDRPRLQGARTFMHTINLGLLAKGQLARGDRQAAASTFREINTLQNLDKSSPDWLETKLLFLRDCEQNAQWELADEVEATMQSQIQELLATQPEPPEPDPETVKNAPYRRVSMTPSQAAVQLKSSRLAGFDILFDNEQLSREQQAVALARIKPQAELYGIDHPEKKAGMYLGISRAQRLLDDPNWRESLTIAQTAAFEAARQAKNWNILPVVAAEWRLTGESEPNRLIANQTLKEWNGWAISQLSELKRTNKKTTVELPQIVESLAPVVAETLIYCDMPAQALDILLKNQKSTDYRWGRTITLCAEQHPGPPPQQLLALPKALRREALKKWTDGLVPEPVYPGEEDSADPSLFSNRIFQ